MNALSAALVWNELKLLTGDPASEWTLGIDLADLMMKLGESPGMKTAEYPLKSFNIRMERFCLRWSSKAL